MLIALLAAAIFLRSLFEIFVSRASIKGIDPYWSALIYDSAVVVICAAIMAGQRIAKVPMRPSSPGAVKYAILAGIAIALFSIVLNKIYEKGGLTFVTPVIYGGVVATSLVGWFVFRESVKPLQAAGIIAIVAGLAMIAIAKSRAA